VAARVTSDLVVIDRVVRADSSDPAVGMTVHGRGAGVEAEEVVVELRSAVDGSILAATVATAADDGSSGQLAPFTATVTPVGTDHAWLVVRSASGAASAGGAVTAVPVAVKGPADPTDYVVVNIRRDDRDGGLNLRSTAGTSNPRVEVLPPGSVVHRFGRLPVDVGGEVWWAVETEQGAFGWAAAGFLAAATPVDDGELRTAAEAVMAAAAAPQALGGSLSFPVSDRVGFTVVVDGEVIDLQPRRVTGAAGWQDPLTDDGRSLVEALSPPPGGPGALSVTANQNRFVDPAMVEVAGRDFGGLPHVTASYVGADGTQHHIHVFVEREPTRVVVVGVIAEVGELAQTG
jgi:hypothetical protein